LHWLWPVVAAALVAAGGAAAAIATGANDSDSGTIVALTPLRAAPPPPAQASATLRPWPRRDGYTIVLAALPTTVGADAARARALAAARAGVPDVGVLDSSRFASLHPGYWIVFSGVHRTLDEALTALPRAVRHARTAYAQQITR
jgi:ABC-type glycerol-3-phosphate transport system substrate-binding protein